MRCRILPTDAAVPVEIHRRLIAETRAAGLVTDGDGSGSVVVIDADALVCREELRLVLYAPGGNRALVARDRGHGVDVNAGTDLDLAGSPNARLAGVAVLSDADLDPHATTVAAALAGVRDVAAVDARGFDPPRFDRERPIDDQLATLMSARTAARVRRRAAVKNDDNAWTTVAVSPWSQLIAAGAARLGLSPNSVTLASMVVAVLAAVAFAIGDTVGTIVGAVGVQLAFGLDCADGQLARLTGRYTALGAWLDWVSDRLKEVVLLVGLAIGADDALLLGAGAIGIAVVRAQLNQSFEDHRTAPAPSPSKGRFGAVAPSRRAKNLITFPYGDRMGMISVVAVVFGLREVLVVWCVWNLAAGLYQLVGRLRRPTGPESSSFGLLIADGPLASALRGRAPYVPSALLALIPIAAVTAVASARDRPEVAIAAVAIAMLAGLVRVRSRLWLMPVATTVVEMAAGGALVAATADDAQLAALVLVAVGGARRLVAATGARHATSSAWSLGWDGRLVSGAALALVDPLAALVVVAVTVGEIMATLASQGAAVSQR